MACLDGADLKGSFLMETDLKNANLTGANLENTNLWGADIECGDWRSQPPKSKSRTDNLRNIRGWRQIEEIIRSNSHH